MDKELISVIIPVYNVGEYLEKCIESVLNQTYQKLEVILVDDGSFDGSGELCDKYAQKDLRVKVFHQKNQGVMGARKLGISKASGEYITFVDADDWIEKNMYEEMLAEGKQCDLISSGAIIEYTENDNGIFCYDKIPEGHYIKAEMKFIWENLIYLKNSNIHAWAFTSMCNRIFKREIVECIYKKQNIDLKMGEDLAFVYKYILICKSVCVMHKAYYHYRMRNGSATHSINKMYLCNINWLYLELEEIFSEHSCKEILIPQLEQLVIERIDKGLNYNMGFKSVNKKVLYELPNKEIIKGKKIVLYGAGRVGKEYYTQLKDLKYNVVLWVDKNYKNCKEEISVKNIKEIKNVEYDYILIAAKRKELAESIMVELKELGVKQGKMLWEESIST